MALHVFGQVGRAAVADNQELIIGVPEMVHELRDSGHAFQGLQHPSLIAQPQPRVDLLPVLADQSTRLLDDHRSAVPLIHGGIHVPPGRLAQPSRDLVVPAENLRSCR